MNDVLGHFRSLKNLPTRKIYNVEHVQAHLIYTIINKNLHVIATTQWKPTIGIEVEELAFHWTL
jgi:hypothetical protein